jgi:aldehyde:ferredoxin oxidoreductase
MKILRIDMSRKKTSFENLPEEWTLIGGRGLIARIMNREVPPETDSLSPDNKLIFACGPLAGTLAPQCGRISVGAKSPLTLGIKESNAGGPSAQKLDKLGIRAIIVEGASKNGDLFCVRVKRDDVELVDAQEHREKKIYSLVESLYNKYGRRPSIIAIGVAGERLYRGASVALTDMYGDPSRNAGRGGLGAVMGSKGLKALIIDDSGTGPPQIVDKDAFTGEVRAWTDMIRKDVGCGLFSTAGTPFTIALNSYQGTMPANNYTTGRPPGFRNVTGEVTRRRVWERNGRMHACMPGCVVQCSIIYLDSEGNRTSAYEYEAVSMLGTNLGIADTDRIACFKHICDDIGVDFIEIGSALAVSSEAGKLRMGDPDSALALLEEIEKGTSLGRTLGDGVVATARAFHIERVPAVRGQALPAHDPRAVKGMGVTYSTSPMGADHTAGLTYKRPFEKDGQIENSLRFQLRAAVCDTFGYCLNAIPGRQASIYSFIANLLNARFGTRVTPDDILEIGKQNLRDERAFNRKSEFSTVHEPFPSFLRSEALPPSGQTFDVDQSEMDEIWEKMETYRLPDKIWEVRFPSLPNMLFGAGVFRKVGESARRLHMRNALIIADPVMEHLGRSDELRSSLEKSGVRSRVFADVEPDPPIEEIERAAAVFKEHGCDGLIALGGGSSMDSAKATAVRVSQKGALAEYENMVGGKARIKPPLPPVICIPTTSGTGSETNQYAVITDREREVKFTLMSDYIIPRLAVIDPEVCATMPPKVTAETGIDALSHCIEGYVGLNDEYHPYFESLAFYGAKLVGRSLKRAFLDGADIQARKDMCMAASFGGIAFAKGLGLGHAISHVLGAFHHVSHGMGCALGLLCFTRINQKACEEQFMELSWALDRGSDLEKSIRCLFSSLEIPTRLQDIGITEADLPQLAFETSLNTVNRAANPEPVTERRILSLLKTFY